VIAPLRQLAPTLLAAALLSVACPTEPDPPVVGPPCRTTSTAPTPGDPVDVLILYDSTGAFGDLGVLYAASIANLTGHFPEVNAQVAPVIEYQRGDIAAHDVVFYVGTVYAEPLPAAFEQDFAAETETTIVWVGGNLWQVAWDAEQDFVNRFGLEFVGNAGSAGTGAETTFFRTVRYKGQELHKYFKYHPESDYAEHDPEVSVVRVVDADRVDVRADIVHSGTGEAIPYALQAANLWHVVDNPFSFLDYDDRYWVFTDLMHDFLGIDHAPSMKALFRLEDVHPFVPPAAIETVRGVIEEAGRPWNMAMVPVWADPLGVYNPDGAGQEWHYEAGDARADAWREQVQAAYDGGAEMVLHGYTHQLGTTANPFNGVTGTDFEFWDAVNNRPVPGDDWDWAVGRVDDGTAIMNELGWNPWCYEVPHYKASMVDYIAITSRYRSVYHQGDYRDFQIELDGTVYDMNDMLDGTLENMDLSPGVFRRRSDRNQAQPFPYVVERDIYGQRVIPETIGNVTPAELVTPEEADFIRTVSQMIHSADIQRVNRCAHASLFYHPFIVERPDYVDAGGPDNLRRLVEGIEDLGYEFVQACALTPAAPLE